MPYTFDKRVNRREREKKNVVNALLKPLDICDSIEKAFVVVTRASRVINSYPKRVVALLIYKLMRSE